MSLNIKRHIPNTLTCFNLLCGCFGLWAVWQGNAYQAAYWVWLAAIFDFADGFAARLLKVQSNIGKELDSLADMVTFGVLPGMVLFALLQQASTIDWLPFLGFATVVFSALRLAKFNVDERQSDHFIGLPTPANALFVTSLALIIYQGDSMFHSIVASEYFLIGVAIVFPLLLVAELPLIALKFKNFGWKENEWKFSLIVASVLLGLFLGVSSLPLIILLYIVLSLVHYGTRKASH